MNQRTDNPGALRTLNARTSRLLVEDYGISFSAWRIAADLESALQAAEAIGYPAVLKSAADDVIHKSDVGCVRTGLNGPEAIPDAFFDVSANAREAGSSNPDLMLVERMVKGTAEIVIGLKRSETFGSTILVGMGGIWVELMRDFALRLCPIEPAEALEMVMTLRGSPILTGMRGRPPGDLEAVISTIVSVSKLGAERSDIVELDLNPVMVMEEGQGAVAVDVRVVLAPGSDQPPPL